MRVNVLPTTVVGHLSMAVKEVRAIHPVALLRKEAQLLQVKQQRKKHPKKQAKLQEVADVVHPVLLPGVLQKVGEVQENNKQEKL